MPTDYPPPGTRVRWRSARRGKTSEREGTVWMIPARYGVLTDDGTLYHPRPECLEIIEEEADA